MLTDPRQTLRRHLAEKQAQADKSAEVQSPGVAPLSPEARTDQFLREHPYYCARFLALSKRELVRELVSLTMQRLGSRQARTQEILAWVESNPKIREQVAGRIRDQRWRNKFTAFVNAAEQEYREKVGVRKIRP